MENEAYRQSNSLRLVGRVFTYDERLHFVLSVDEERYLAQVSTRKAGETQIIEMPLNEIIMRVTGYQPA